MGRDRSLTYFGKDWGWVWVS